MAVLNLQRHPSMTNGSKTKEPAQKTETTGGDTVEETIQKMKANLIRYARSNDRRMILRSLKDVKLLNCLSLDVAQNSEGPLFDLEKEVAEESMTINGVSVKGVDFHPKSGVLDTVGVAVKNSSIPLLKNICRELCERPDVSMSSRELYEKLIVRLAKSTSSADPYFRLNSLLGSPDLLVMPLDNDIVSTSGVQPLRSTTLVVKPREPGEIPTPPANELNIYAANGEVHITLQQTYKFGLLRKADVKSNRPWFTIHAVVKERANLSNNNCVRQLKVVLPDLY